MIVHTAASMQSIILHEFQRWARDRYAKELANEVTMPADTVRRSSHGQAYGNYADLNRRLVWLSEIVDEPVNELACKFGKALFATLMQAMSVDRSQHKTAIQFLSELDHLSERWRRAGATELPVVEITHREPGRLDLRMQSRLQSWDLSEGLLYGCGDYFGQPLLLERLPTQDPRNWSACFSILCPSEMYEHYR